MTTRHVHLNGRIVPEPEACVSPFDRGFLLGDAVFETMRAYGGRLHALDRHLARLRRSCDAARLPFPDALESAVVDTLRANDLTDAAVRVTVSRGPGGRGASPKGAGPATVLVTAAPVHHDLAVYERGLRLVTASRRRVGAASIDPGLKTTNYLVHVLARMEAEDAGADDALFLDEAGHAVEATQANVFAIVGDALVTPPLSSGCLPGVTREDLLALAPEVGLRAEERMVRPDDLLAADEVFLSASILEVAGVVSLDGRAIGDGAPGARTRALHARYRLQAQGGG